MYHSMLAGPADPSQKQYTQPDGSIVAFYLHGDEHLNWMTDENGDVIEIGEDGYVFRSSMPSVSQFKRAAVSRRNASIRPHMGTQTGSRHFMVILVQYPDCPFITTTEQFEDFFNGNGAGSTDSVQNYYNEQSDGLFTPVFDIYGPVTVSNNRANYKENAKGALSEALGQLVDSGALNLSDYITSNWGILENYIDDVIMIFAGHSRASGDNDGIWPSRQTGTIYNKGKNYVKSFCCAPELQGSSGTTLAGIGHICHEFGHCMGLPDFYDTNSSSHGGNVTHACMDYSLMGSGSYNNSSKTPPPLSIAERAICGWANISTDIQPISASGNLTLYEIGQDASRTRAYAIPTDKEGEIFICEYRSLVQNRWSAGLARGGMLVYHMDKSDRSVSQDAETETAADWWDYGIINNNGSHPLFYLIPSGDQSNLKASDKQLIPFPGSQNVITYNPVSWNNTTTYISLSGIPNANGASMSFKAHVRAFPLINNPQAGIYTSGGTFTLKLSPGSEGTESVSQWIYDGNVVGSSDPGPQVTLTDGVHTIEAVLSSGKKLRLSITAE